MMRKENLRVYDTLEQGTPEWLQARAGVITASSVKLIIGEKLNRKTKRYELVCLDGDTANDYLLEKAEEIITGRPAPTIVETWAMRRGNELEPYARDHYSMTREPVNEVGFIVRTLADGSKVGYSPDGMVGDTGLIEIKAKEHKYHLRTLVNDWLPPEHYAQLQTGLFVTGRKWIDYVSMPDTRRSGLGRPGRLAVRRVSPNPLWQDNLERLLMSANMQVRGYVEKMKYRNVADYDLPIIEDL